MLKNLSLPVDYGEQISKTCGEVVCQGLNNFFINCNLCKVKIFDFFEFVDHIQNRHFKDLSLATNKFKPNYYEETDKEYNARVIKIGIDEKQEQKPVKREQKPAKQEPEQNKAEEYVVKCEQNTDNFQWDDNLDFDRDYQDADYDDDDSDDVEANDMDNKNKEEELTVLKKKVRKSKELACEICGKLYADSKRLKMHITTAHVRAKPFQCTLCEMAFSLKRSLDHHTARAHTGFKCHICEKVLRTNPSLKRHINIHTAEKSFFCTEENCNKAFLTRRQLRDHMMHHKEPELMCEECGFKCYKRESLVVHQRNHTGEKPYACEKCDRRFTTNSLLNEHRASHQERKHICDVCGKSFNRPKALYHHKHLHLPVKKFVCKMCGAAYAQAAGLSAHLRKHREEGPNINIVRDDDGTVNVMKASAITNKLNNF